MTEMTGDEISAMLADERIGRLAMADSQGRPYIIPLPFTWLDGALYLRLPMSGRKGEILQSNRHVCFEVDSYSDRLDQYASILIEGALQPVTDLDEKRRARQASQEKYLRLRGGYRPGHKRGTSLETLALQKIEPRHVSGRKKEPLPQ